MDDTRFDLWTRTLATDNWTRRGAGRLALAGGLAALGMSAGAGTALACRRNKKRCQGSDRAERNASCCSGTCKRSGSRRNGRRSKTIWKCRPTSGAAGCTIEQDQCIQQPEDELIPCPKNPDGFCVLRDNGKPMCIQLIVCRTCASDADCTDLPNGKCSTTCEICGLISPATGPQGCFYPPE